MKVSNLFSALPGMVRCVAASAAATIALASAAHAAVVTYNFEGIVRIEGSMLEGDVDSSFSGSLSFDTSTEEVGNGDEGGNGAFYEMASLELDGKEFDPDKLSMFIDAESGFVQFNNFTNGSRFSITLFDDAVQTIFSNLLTELPVLALNDFAPISSSDDGLQLDGTRLNGNINGGSGILIRNGVGELTSFEIAAVPLPATGWMLIAGFGSLLAMRRRSKAV